MRATGAGLILSAVAASLAGLVSSSVFGAVHAVYLVATVGVPIAALLLIGRWAAGRGRLLWAAVALLPAALGVYATHIEPFWLRVDHAQLDVDAVRPGSESLVVAVFSDLQTTGIGDYESDVIDRLLGHQPDIVLIPGDFWHLDRARFDERRSEFAGAMKRLASVPVVVAVRGDTDSVAGLRQLTAGTSAVVLDNELAVFDVKGHWVRIAGISLDEDEVAAVDLARTFGGSARSVDIVVSHRPDEIERFGANADFDLLVAGHTHGGQIALPLFGPLVTLSDVPREVAAGGLHELNGNPIYVSTGVGRERGAAPQVRLGARPSIGIVVLN